MERSHAKIDRCGNKMQTNSVGKGNYLRSASFIVEMGKKYVNLWPYYIYNIMGSEFHMTFPTSKIKDADLGYLSFTTDIV